MFFSERPVRVGAFSSTFANTVAFSTPVTTLSSDAFEPPPDVFEPPPDVFEPPPDVFEPPPDVFEPPPDAFESLPAAFEPLPDAFEPAPAVLDLPAPFCVTIARYLHSAKDP
jgi:hypothetical protein